MRSHQEEGSVAGTLELGMINSTWEGTHVGLEEGIRKAKEIGFDTYDIFNDPLDIDDATRQLIKDTCAEVGLPIRSCVCVAFGIVDFNPSVVRFTLDRVRAYIDQAAFFGARNVLLVIGEYYWDGEVFPREAIWTMAKERCQQLADYAAERGIEIVLELEPFTEALVNNTDNLVRFVREVDRPNFRANADISHLHLSDASFEDVKKMQGLIGHIHLSDCDGKVHGDLPAGLGVTPIKEYLQAIVDTGYQGTVSIELEYSPNPEQIVEWATTAYTNTAAIMREIGVRP
jgi:sugar phosphate isomerase/epimerase